MDRCIGLTPQLSAKRSFCFYYLVLYKHIWDSKSIHEKLRNNSKIKFNQNNFSCYWKDSGFLACQFLSQSLFDIIKIASISHLFFYVRVAQICSIEFEGFIYKICSISLWFALPVTLENWSLDLLKLINWLDTLYSDPKYVEHV